MNLGRAGQNERKKGAKELQERGRRVRKGRSDGWIHGWMGEWVDESINGWVDEQLKR